jgi:hypothetical protein
MDEDTKMKISLANKGKKRDEATRERMSIKKIGNKNSAGPGRVCGKRGPMSAETKMKIAERLKGNQNSKKNHSSNPISNMELKPYLKCI